MHSYLRAIGFGNLKSESEVEEILDEVYRHYDHRNAVKEDGGAFLEMTREFGPDLGICLCGTLDENGFHRQYYFPYCRAHQVTTTEEITVEPRLSGDSFAGICDDGRVGASLIFYLQNPAAYHKEQAFNLLRARKTAASFSALSTQGTILLPIHKDEKKEDERRRGMVNRNRLISEARNGDQEAIESLTIEDMDLYSMISKRIEHEDVLSIVDTYFMPCGMECDQYQILGNINYYTKIKNKFTGESVYQLNVECNDMVFDVCINASDLLGEPEEGRRFKGGIWLQGKVEYE